jgi:hypothetical protein
MSKQRSRLVGSWFGWLLAAASTLVFAVALSARQLPAQQPAASAAPQAQSGSQAKPSGKAETHITSEQQKELFSLVDELLKFSSDESGLPVKSEVKRQFISRADVASYLKKKFDEDESAKRLERSEIVLKKFGMLDHDFTLKPFLLDLLKEQIEAYYDSKTKTIFMLDWVDVDEQKPVLAHELTHALQDQHTDLEKWNDQTPDAVSTTFAEDADHVTRDEMDTAREAVAEGQATAVMMDYILKPLGKSLVKDPEVLEVVTQQIADPESSPVLARAPLLLSESLLFPYREGLSFEQDVWMDQGKAAAFTGALDRPPTSTWEIVNPREYERKSVPAVPLLPNIHPMVDKEYKPYDIGQIGELDVRILTKIFAGETISGNLTPAWNGGIYWAGQLRHATAAEKASTASVAIFYLSAWRNAASASAFAKIYANNLGRKYSGLKSDPEAASEASASGDVERIYTTNEGPVLIVTRGKYVFVAESFGLSLARKLATLVLGAQGSGEVKQAQNLPMASPANTQSLTGSLTHLFSSMGVMKAEVDAALRAGK